MKLRFVLACALFLMSTAEAIHLGSLIAAHGYIFPISDHVLTLKDDGTLYRFQVHKAEPQRYLDACGQDCEYRIR